jgi:FAD/FMN-containing dehydrogenase
VEAGLSSELAFPGEKTYEESIESYWSLLTHLRPNCVLQPRGTQNVSNAVKALVDANDTQPCQFAIRSGGHSTWAGSNNIQDGVTIDLKHMSKTTYNANNSTASIGPAARWAEVYSTLDAQGIAVAGGRAGDVGVGGLILGGGNSFYAAREGFGRFPP